MGESLNSTVLEGISGSIARCSKKEKSKGAFGQRSCAFSVSFCLVKSFLWVVSQQVWFFLVSPNGKDSLMSLGQSFGGRSYHITEGSKTPVMKMRT